MTCWCGKPFKGLLAASSLRSHQKREHPKNPNNLYPKD